MTKRRKYGLYLLLIAIPIGAYGALNFQIGGASSTASAIGVAISSTFGLSFFVGGLVMMATKKSLGIWNPDDKGKKDRGVVLASQNVVGDSSVLKEKPLTPERVAEIKKNNQKAVKEFADKIRKETKEEILKPKEVPPMTTLTPAEKMLKLDELEEDDKALDKMKDTNEKARIEMRAEIKKDGFERNENGIWVPIKKTK